MGLAMNQESARRVSSSQIEIRHLRYFVAVADAKHFTRAAESLHLAQPPLSQAIAQLEKHLGVRLLDRSTRRVELTSAGTVFLERARRILAELDQSVVDAIRSDRGELGHLTVGFVGSVTYELLPRIVRTYSEARPEITLELRGELLTPTQVQMLLNEDLDVGFLRPPVRTPGLELRVVRHDPLIALLPYRHQLASYQTIELSALRGEAFIAYPSGDESVMSDRVEDACLEAGFRPRVVQEVRETFTMLCFVAAGLGVALSPAAVRHVQVAGVSYCSLAKPTVTVPLAMAWRRDDRSPALHNFLSTMRSMLPTYR